MVWHPDAGQSDMNPARGAGHREIDIGFLGEHVDIKHQGCGGVREAGGGELGSLSDHGPR